MGWEKRNAETQKIWQDHILIYRILLITVIVILGLWIFGNNALSLVDNMLGYITNVFTEALSIIVTILVLNVYARRREKRDQDDLQERLDQQLKEELYSNLRTPSNDLVLSALHRLREKNWLDTDFSNQNLYRADWTKAYIGGMDFSKANLQGAKFAGVTATNENMGIQRVNFSNANLNLVNLQGAELGFANLQGAYLQRANLSGARLYEANLEGVNLRNANLEGTDLWDANLSRAILRGANLSRAKLLDANLKGAKLENATFNEETYLPDTTKWAPDTDMERFTNPEHPNFWQPE